MLPETSATYANERPIVGGKSSFGGGGGSTNFTRPFLDGDWLGHAPLAVCSGSGSPAPPALGRPALGLRWLLTGLTGRAVDPAVPPVAGRVPRNACRVDGPLGTAVFCACASGMMNITKPKPAAAAENVLQHGAFIYPMSLPLSSLTSSDRGRLLCFLPGCKYNPAYKNIIYGCSKHGAAEKLPTFAGRCGRTERLPAFPKLENPPTHGSIGSGALPSALTFSIA